MNKIMNLGQNVLLGFILSMLFFPVANAGLVEIYMNDSKEDLVITEVNTTISYGTDIILEFHIKGAYMFSDDADDEEFSVHNLNIDVEFLNDEDLRDTCRACAAPRYVPPKDNEIRDYDVYEVKFYSDYADFIDYTGDIRFNIVMSNKTLSVITGASTIIQLTIEEASTKDETSSGISLPGIPAPIMDNLVIILIGLVGFIILSFGIYTFILAPEDKTASMYRMKESINPLSKSLTGVGYNSELPTESKLKRLEDSKADSDDEEEKIEDDEYEDYDDDEEDEDFDESEILAKLTGGKTLKDTKDNDDETKVAPTPKKKPIKRTIMKGVAKKKIVKRVAPPISNESNVNMEKDIKNITCPSCKTVHNIDENTPRFICSCGRRIRV